MRSVDRVREYFIQRGLNIDVKELNASARTAQLAADAVGTALGTLASSNRSSSSHRMIGRFSRSSPAISAATRQKHWHPMVRL